MNPADWPLTRDLVLIGGGHAHALLLRMWGMAPLPGARLTLINPDPVAPYTGMLPGHVAGHYARDDLMIDLVPLARHAGARLVLDRAVGIDRAGHQVMLAGRGPIRYDVASIDIGIGSGLPAVPGFAEHAVAAKAMADYAALWQRFLARAVPEPRVVIIGGGIGGVELALASAHRLGAGARVVLLERGDAALPDVGGGARRALLAHLARLGVQVLTGARPVRFQAAAVWLQDGRSVPSDFTLSVVGGQPQAWLAETGLDLAEGFVRVGPTLQSSDAAIFAVGDCACLTHAPRPKAGVFAVRQAPVLLHNLRAALAERPMRQYWPQRDYLKLVSTGGKGAVADRFGLRLDGAYMWRLKHRIDRRFMQQFAAYPAMAWVEVPTLAAAGVATALQGAPLCGGCGAKVGAAELSAALTAVPAPQRADVVSGPGDDAAVLRAGSGFQVITTDHLRAFVADPCLMARITAVHAMGDIWAMGARPQVALAQVTLPRMASALQAATLAEIMAAALAVFTAAGADVVGGHTSVGAEMTIGFTVTGLADRVVPKGGAEAGDVLVLTKPLGTGVILAAEMAGRRLPGFLLGEVVAGACTAMVHPLSGAAALLGPVARAMTDVTGFGLAGHLLEILAASGKGAEIRLCDVPMLHGAVAYAAAGVASSLAPANRAAVAGRMRFAESAAAALLFDPQTAGGLLAAVPGDRLQPVLAALAASGEAAWVIGQVTDGPVLLQVEG